MLPMDPEIGVMQPQANACLEPSEAERHKERLSSWAFAYTLISDFRLPEL